MSKINFRTILQIRPMRDQNYSAVAGDCGDYEMDEADIKCETSPSTVRESNVYEVSINTTLLQIYVDDKPV